jgi:hypothetical protein
MHYGLGMATNRNQPTFRTLIARKPGTCKKCQVAFPAGTSIRWNGYNAWHIGDECPARTVRVSAAPVGQTAADIINENRRLRDELADLKARVARVAPTMTVAEYAAARQSSSIFDTAGDLAGETPPLPAYQPTTMDGRPAGALRDGLPCDDAPCCGHGGPCGTPMADLDYYFAQTV